MLTSRCDEGFLITINVLPDDVLLDIFDFVLHENQEIEWETLAHVCRRWRSVVFQSPLRLNLQLVCTRKTRARDTLDIWPPLPLTIHDHAMFRNEATGVDNIIAALEHHDRVRQIGLIYLTSPELEYVTDSAAMQKPFQELTDLQLGMYEDDEAATSRFVLGWNRTTSAITLLAQDSFSGITETTFVRHSPCQT